MQDLWGPRCSNGSPRLSEPPVRWRRHSPCVREAPGAGVGISAPSFTQCSPVYRVFLFPPSLASGGFHAGETRSQLSGNPSTLGDLSGECPAVIFLGRWKRHNHRVSLGVLGLRPSRIPTFLRLGRGQGGRVPIPGDPPGCCKCLPRAFGMPSHHWLWWLVSFPKTRAPIGQGLCLHFLWILRRFAD